MGLSVEARVPRVLHLGSSTGLYGAERWILALLRNLPAGEAVRSFVGTIKDAPGPEPELCVQAARLGFPAHVFEAHGRISHAAVGQMREFIRANAIDVVHTHGYKTDLIGLFAVRGTTCKIVSTPHGWSANAGLKVQVYEWLDRMAFPFVDAVVPLSQDLYDGLAKLPFMGGRLRLIQNGVDLSEVDATAEVSPELAAARVRGAFVVGYIGQLIPRKGLDVLIRAFANLDISDKLLCLVGEGPQRAELEALASQVCKPGQVQFFGYRPDRIALLRGFDLFVLASGLEGIPRCLLESLAAGVPIAATDIPGCRDLADGVSTGWLFPVGDVQRLTEALTLAHDQPARRAAFAQAGRQRVRTLFSAERMAREYVALYRKMTGAIAPNSAPPAQEAA